ncbi:MAG: hypothetical protein IJM75_01600 [Ruminococcus sp.]|nr:hypothetical protein [Ruminococcus sp.]
MGLLGKLFGDDDLDKKAKGFFDSLVGSVQNKPQNNNTQNTEQSYYAAPSPAPAAAQNGPSGFSWGDTMPNEENQFNSGLTYDAYFEKVYREDFPEYRVTKQMSRTGKCCVFTFERDGRVCLKVEVLSQSSAPYKIRQECLQSGIGYTRFYHNHHGWWNTRRYVDERTRNAIK